MRSRLLLVALAALTLAAAGCGGGEKASDTNLPGDAAKGKQVFADAGCAGCHTLRAANASGTKGPNLDTVGPGYQRVVEQVTNGSPAMPSFEFKLDKDEIRNVAAFVADSTGGGLKGQPVAGKFKPDDKKLEDCKGDFACYEQAYGNLAYDEGPKVALARFEQAISKAGAIEGNCHRIAHAIGAASLAHFKGKVGPAFAAGTAACWSGYYHGVVERALVDVKSDRARPGRPRDVRRPRSQGGPDVHALPVRPRARTRADDLHALRHAAVAQGLRRAQGQLGPDLVHRRRLHGEPVVLVRREVEVAEGRRPRSIRATRSRAPQDLLLPDGDLADPADGRLRLREGVEAVPKERAAVGRNLLPIARARRLRT